jgi:hypothetical protein
MQDEAAYYNCIRDVAYPTQVQVAKSGTKVISINEERQKNKGVRSRPTCCASSPVTGIMGFGPATNNTAFNNGIDTAKFM